MHQLGHIYPKFTAGWKKLETYLQRSEVIFYGIICVLLMLRGILGHWAGIWMISKAYSDDALMIRYADFQGYFFDRTLPWHDELLKDMGYPLFLQMVHFFGINYVDAITALWFLAALLIGRSFDALTQSGNRVVFIAIYSFILFHPIAFDAMAGTRLYRNSILTPAYFIVFAMSAITFARYFYQKTCDLKYLFLWQITFGILFTWTYYLKEDGIWLLLCMISVTLGILGILIFVNIREQYFRINFFLVHVSLLLLPFAVFWGGTVAYRMINYQYFGVREINTRTAGELERFCKNIYRIDSKERTVAIWAPTDAVMQAFEASKTLKENKELREAILHTPWFNHDIRSTPIVGDFLSWVLPTALAESKTCTSQLEMQTYLRYVNDELEESFNKGILKEDDKIQLIPSMGGCSLTEIFDLRKSIAKEYFMVIVPAYIYTHPVLTSYDFNIYNLDKNEDAHVILQASEYTGINMFEDNNHEKLINSIANVQFITYSVLQCALVWMTWFGTVYFLRKCLIRKECLESKEYLCVFIVVAMLLVSSVYALAIAWFTKFLFVNGGKLVGMLCLNFYSVGLIPMLVFVELSGGYLFYRYIQQKNHIRE